MNTPPDSCGDDRRYDTRETGEIGRTTECMKGDAAQKELWERIVADLRKHGEVGSFGLESCICKLRLLEDTGTKLVLEYPHELPIAWVELNYLDYIINSATRILRGARSIELREAAPPSPATAEDPAPAQRTVDSSAAGTAPADGSGGKLPFKFAAAVAGPPPIGNKVTARRKRTNVPFTSGLNEDYTFRTFVVGENNEFAYAAACAVVKKTGRIYNPLFIHGASGLGKTHLLQAIGNALREQCEDTRVLYITCEDFTNSYIDALAHKKDDKGDSLSNFRRKYRKADVLLIDDVQFLARKDKTQEEFFYTFNALFSAGKQIVLTSDCPASRVMHIDERLTSRFEQGLCVSLQPPPYETRMAILRAKRRIWRSELVSDDVLDFLAKNITHSVRRLEGALTRLATFASFSNRCLSVADARPHVRDFLREEPSSRLSVRDIQQCVADEFNVRVADLNGRCRTARIAHPRQIAMFLARNHTGSSLQDIGAAFGGRDHGTVIHAARTIAAKLAADSCLRDSVKRIMNALGI